MLISVQLNEADKHELAAECIAEESQYLCAACVRLSVQKALHAARVYLAAPPLPMRLTCRGSLVM